MTLHYKNQLEKRRNQNLFRTLKSNGVGLDFSSNDYLSLHQDPVWRNYLKDQIPEELWLESSPSSRLIAGNSSQKEAIEAWFAEFFKDESALFFPSGYAANQSVISTIASKTDTIIYDQYCHASIREALQLSPAKCLKFRHNDVEDLERLLIKTKGQVYVVIESLYSMDGDFCPLKSIVELCKKHKGLLIVDEAHTTGLYGDKGEGFCVELGLEKEIFCRIMTFGKAVACHGAVVLGPTDFRSFLINFARPFIYSTSPPILSFMKAQKSLDCISKHPEWRANLQENASYLAQCLGIQSKETNPFQSPIIPFLDTDFQKLKEFERQLEKQHIFVKAIGSPTIPKGEERLRFSIQRQHTSSDLELLAGLVNDVFV
ncbi:MAG: aminotransferase class I/II-fold pyridoxal phosphate-dependent enzyme [Flavobacteriales bacterium]